MEAVLIAHHKNHNQSYGRNQSHITTDFRSVGSGPSGNFGDINCRTFHSGTGLLPTPLKYCSVATPVTRKPSTASAKTPSPCVNENPKSSKGSSVRSCTDPIPIKINIKNEQGDFSFSDLWAGPAYSKSPPPSSLPIPKFSVCPKRTVSLELPKLASEIDFHPIAKSAPTSPTWVRRSGLNDLFDSPDSATKTLRRILNLDTTDE